MPDPKRFAVPLDELDDVRVDLAQQVTEEDVAAPPDAAIWNVGRLGPYGGGGGGAAVDCDGGE